MQRSGFSESLLMQQQHEAQPLPLRLQEPQLVPTNHGNEEATSGTSQLQQAGDDDDDEPPYSVAAEVRYFFEQGIPLMLSAVLEWGAPPLITMILAGHTEDGTLLQASLGFARVFYNTTCLMPCNACFAYLAAVVPSCIGARRTDRIPRYFQRSLLISFVVVLPCLVLQLFSEPIMMSLGVPVGIAEGVGQYTRLMIGTTCLYVIECQLEILFISLQYVKSAAFIGLVTGLGVDVGVFYAFVYVHGWGMWGVALKEVIVKAARVLMWLVLALYFGLWRTLFVPSVSAAREPLLTRREFAYYLSQALPQLGKSFGGWFIFELQLLLLTKIRGITSAARAAGAIWVQCEMATAAVMSGWIDVAEMRCLKLLGREDGHGASRSFLIHNALAAIAVGLTTALPVLVSANAISRVASADPAVAGALEPVLWILAVHSQSRITQLITSSVLIKVGKPWLNVIATYVAFYAVGAPPALVGSLTDLFATSLVAKMTFCLSCTSIAQTALAAVFGLTFFRMDWTATARYVHERAQSDESSSGCAPLASS